MDSGRFFVYFGLGAAQLGFGGFPVLVSKFGKGTNLDPMIYVLIRDFFATIILTAVALCVEKKILIPQKRELPKFIMLGFFGMFLTRISFVWAIYFTSASIASIMQPSIPVWTYLLAACTRIEKIPSIKTKTGLARFVGIIFAMTGAVMICLGKLRDMQTSTSNKSTGKQVFGYVILVVNTVSMAVFLLLQRKFISSVQTSRWKDMPFNVVTWSYIFGYCFQLLANIYNMIWRPETFTGVEIDALYPILYGIFIVSVFGFAMLIWANSKLTPTIVSSFLPLQSLFGVILAKIVLHDDLSTIQIVGAVILVVALFLILFGSYNDKQRESVEEGSPMTEILTGEEDLEKKEEI